MREASFQRARLCQLTDQQDACASALGMGRLLGRDPQHPRWGRGRPRLDGSFNGDTTVLVVATVDQRPTKPSSTGALTHSGDSRLARHIGDAVLREDARGARLAKERRDSPDASTPPWPPSWPTTGPPPWLAPPGTASTSERATTPGAPLIPGP